MKAATSLKRGRLALGVLFLLLSGAVFLDFRGALGPVVYQIVTWVQFVPSAIRFHHLAGLAALGFLAVAVITLLLGRVYCSTVCPLGLFQDLMGRVSKWVGRGLGRRGKPYAYTPERPWLRYGVLAAVLLTLVAGSPALLHLLDPFSIFGKIMGGLFRPVYYGMNNLLAEVLRGWGIHALYRVDTRLGSVWPLLLPLMLLCLVALFALPWGRLYCNTLCPVGTLLGILSRRALFRVAIDAEHCTGCARCAIACKSHCIDLDRRAVDHSRCVTCFNCLNRCSRGGISFRYHPWLGQDRRTLPSPPAEAKNLPGQTEPRRHFLWRLAAAWAGFPLATRLLPASVARTAVDAPGLPPTATLPSTIPESKTHPVTPPGSTGREQFQARCTACQLCVSVCPTKVLQPSFLEYGLSGMMQPRLDFHASFCNFECVRCTEVCPTGAIERIRPETKTRTRIGTVRLELGNCIVQTQGTACGACAEHCPTQAVHMIPHGQGGLTIPALREEQCIGCGACEYICPTRPFRAIYVDGLPRHQWARPPAIKPLQFEASDGFPF